MPPDLISLMIERALTLMVPIGGIALTEQANPTQAISSKEKPRRDFLFILILS